MNLPRRKTDRAGTIESVREDGMLFTVTLDDDGRKLSFDMGALWRNSESVSGPRVGDRVFAVTSETGEFIAARRMTKEEREEVEKSQAKQEREDADKSQVKPIENSDAGSRRNGWSWTVGEPYDGGVIDAAEQLAGDASGSFPSYDREELERIATWLAWRITDGWSDGFPLLRMRDYSNHVRSLAASALAAHRARSRPSEEQKAKPATCRRLEWRKTEPSRGELDGCVARASLGDNNESAVVKIEATSTNDGRAIYEVDLEIPLWPMRSEEKAKLMAVALLRKLRDELNALDLRE